MRQDHSSILLISPPFAFVYQGAAVLQGVPHSPLLSLSTLAAGVLARGHRVRLLDMNIHPRPLDAVREAVVRHNPRWVGVTVVTPLWDAVQAIVDAVRSTGTGARIALGGPHVSAMPRQALEEAGADAVVFGEGDEALADLLEADPLEALPGIGVRLGDGEVRLGPSRSLLQDLDRLPMPAWELYDLRRYSTTHLLSRRSPAGWIETSRGCPFDCVYCSKHTFGRSFRTKSPGRVVDEMARMLDLGFREIHIADDCFTAAPRRVRAICEEILSRRLRFPWAPVIGIRVDHLEPDLLRLMHRAGCYRVYFGIESGSEQLLETVHKGISLDEVRRAVRESRRAGMETCGFFMIALPGETEETMAQTRRFAIDLNLDLAKISVTVPLPGTPLFQRLEQEGRLLSRRWADYKYHVPAYNIYRHENLEWDTVEENLRLFYRAFYFRPRLILRRLAYALRSGTLLADLRAAMRTDW